MDIGTGERFELPGGALASFTARAQGNLSSVGGDGADRGLAARERLRQTLGVRALLRGYQVHGSVVGRVRATGERFGPGGVVPVELEDRASQPMFEADGHAVAAPGLAAMVLTADCIPVVLGCEGAAAALHAGWRGLAAGVLEEGVSALREVGGTGDIAAVVGPCAGACCYEVGEEVHAAFAWAHRTGRLIDLRAIAHERLLAAGVAQVADVAACTICDERFFSHRREGASAGRQAGLAWIAQ
jgi:YfiH family protein